MNIKVVIFVLAIVWSNILAGKLLINWLFHISHVSTHVFVSRRIF